MLLTRRVDPAVLGGLRVELDGMLYDGTVSGKKRYAVADVVAVRIPLACRGKLILVLVGNILQYGYCVRNCYLFIAVCVAVLYSTRCGSGGRC